MQPHYNTNNEIVDTYLSQSQDLKPATATRPVIIHIFSYVICNEPKRPMQCSFESLHLIIYLSRDNFLQSKL